jgi:hypothetical protein
MEELMQPATLSKNGRLAIGSSDFSLYSIGWKSSSVWESLANSHNQYMDPAAVPLGTTLL